jgi:hypothetical protein
VADARIATKREVEMTHAETDERLERLEALVRRDPAGRGLISSEADRGVLCAGHLSGAVKSLVENPGPVAILTGFFIPHANPAAAETDGPPGAVTLGRVLSGLGHQVVLMTDEPCRGGLVASARAAGLDDVPLEVVPLAGASQWCHEFLSRRQQGDGLKHLVAIERVGPSHDLDSMTVQPREGAPPEAEFLERVPNETWGCCHNMRARVIDEWTADVSVLFDRLNEFCPGAVTIGIGDGGNEIGMGAVPWEELVARLPGDHSARIPCRIATDWNVLAGISNWGAWSLSAAVALFAGRVDLVEPLSLDWQYELVERLVAEGPGVDGPSGEAVVGVDGLSMDDYLVPWSGIRGELGLL